MGKLLKVFVVFGTRPETIKLSPLITELKNYSDLETTVCILRQQPKLVGQSLALFGINSDFEMAFPFGNAGLLSPSIFKKISSVFSVAWGLFRFVQLIRKKRPDLVLVQGDTSTALLVALLTCHFKISIGHIEAGLRTYNKYSPFPEEINRKLISAIADIHFAPTAGAKENLLKEGVKESDIFVTGNTVMDAVRLISGYQQKIEKGKAINDFFQDAYGFDLSDTNKKMIFFTTHRRESFGGEMESIMRAVKMIADKYKNVFIVYPMHPNPNVVKIAHAILNGTPRIFFIDSVEYDKYIFLLKKANFVITDSGGLQEEISFFGKPTIVVRNVTERPEGLEGGNLILAGTKMDKIFNYASRLIDDKSFYSSMAKKHTLFGDGFSSKRIADYIFLYLAKSR